MDSFLESLKQEIKCSLCKDILTEPKILQCFHTFCKPCIKRNAELIEKANVFKCPKCKSETPLPGLMLNDLKPSPRHSRILELLEFLNSEKFCSVCESKPKATWYCLDRHRLLCEDCSKTNSIINKDQQNVSLIELTEHDIKRILKRENLCQDHNQAYEFFCKDCEECICIHCFRSRQCRAHQTVSMVKEFLLDFLVKEEQEKLKIQKEEIQKDIEKCKEISLTTKRDGEKAKAEIEETVRQVINKLQKWKEQLYKDIDQRTEEAERKSRKEQERLSRWMGCASDYIDEMKKFGVVSEIFEATKNIEVYPLSVPDSSRFKFVMNDECSRFLNSSLYSNHGLGSLKQVDMTAAIHVSDPELEALKEAKLTLLTAIEASPENHDGSVCTSDGAVAPVKKTLENESKEGEKSPQNSGKKSEIMNDVKEQLSTAEATEETHHVSVTKSAREERIVSEPHDVVDVTISPEENVEKNENYWRSDGKIEVEFMAKVAGQLTAEVLVNGKHVSNSPLVMNVKPQKIKITGEFDTKPPKGKEPLNRYAGITVNKDSSRIAVSDWTSYFVHVFTADGDLLLKYGGKGSEREQLSCPNGLAFLNETDLVIADCNNHRICIVDTTTGKLIKTFGSHGNGNGEFNEPYGVHVDDNSNIIVCDHDNHRVQVFTRDGDYQYQFGLTKDDSFHPVSVVTHHERFYVSDYTNNAVQVFEKKDDAMTKVSTVGCNGSGDGQLQGPCGLAIDNDHHLLVCDSGNNRIQKFTLDGRLVGKTYDKIEKPYEIAVGKDGALTTTVSSKIFIVK